VAIDKKFIVKNGLTTQNITFVDNVVSSTSNIDVTMLSSNTLSFSGTSGQLFSITDSMTGTIFSVNDISGIPSIEVFDNSSVQLVEVYGNVVVGGTSDLGYKLRVIGNTRVDGNVYIANSIANVQSIQFDTSSDVVAAPGSLSWNKDDNTLNLGLTANTTLQIGQEQFYYVKNQTGNTIPNGTVVRADGTIGSSGIIKVAPALADGTYPSKYIMGVATETIPDGTDGFVASFGKIRGIDTSMFSEGDILYASPSIAGGLSNTVPIAPNNIVTVAIVVTKSINNGELLVRPTYASSLFEDESVYLRDLQDEQAIVYVSANARFENKAISGGGGDVANTWVNANDYATLLSAYSNDGVTVNAALANDWTTYSILAANDGITLSTALANDYSTLLAASANDYNTLETARANDYSSYLTLTANIYNTFAYLNANTGGGSGDASNTWVNANDWATLQSAYANDYALYTSIATFNVIAVSGQANVTANSFGTTLRFVAGPNVTIVTNAATSSITFDSVSEGGGGGTDQYARTIAYLGL
jgi:hypothetical protein